MALSKITEQERELMKQKSAQSLPDVPSIQNWTPKQFKNAITKVLFDNKESFYAYHNKLVEEIVEDYLTKEDEKVYKFDKTFTSYVEFAKDCLLAYNSGTSKIFYAKYNDFDLIGLCKTDSNVLIISGEGKIVSSDGIKEIPVTISQLLSKTAKIEDVEVQTLKVTDVIDATNSTLLVSKPNASNHAVRLQDLNEIKTELQEKIDGIEAAQNLLDIVGSYKTGDDSLLRYPTINLKNNDKIKVLEDEERGNAGTYYKWNGTAWEYIGKDGNYYTQAEVDNIKNELLSEIQSLRQLVNTLMASNVSYKED